VVSVPGAARVGGVGDCDVWCGMEKDRWGPCKCDLRHRLVSVGVDKVDS
jgi:hypothetical protein